MIFNNRTKNLCNRSRQDHIKAEEMTFGTIRYIIFTTTWMLHSTYVSNFLDEFHITNLKSVYCFIETTIFNKLSNNFESNLISPFINLRHVNIINEKNHFFVSWRNESIFTSGFYIASSINRVLEVLWSGS